MASLKTKVDDLDVGKLKNVPGCLSRLIIVVDEMLSKRLCIIDWLPKSTLLIQRCQDTSVLVNKTKVWFGQVRSRKDVDNKISNSIGLVKKTDYNTEIEKIPSDAGLVTTAAPNTKVTRIGNKIADIIHLVIKAALNTKATEVENKILDINNLTIKAA